VAVSGRAPAGFVGCDADGDVCPGWKFHGEDAYEVEVARAEAVFVQDPVGRAP